MQDTGGSAGEERPIDTERKLDPIVEAVRAKLLERSQIGIKKYGVTLQDAKLSRLETLTHLQQELLDAANYIEVEIQNERNKLKWFEADPTWPKTGVQHIFNLGKIDEN